MYYSRYETSSSDVYGNEATMIVLSFLAAIIIIYGQKTRLYNSIMKVYIYRDNIIDSRRMTAITVTLEEGRPPPSRLRTFPGSSAEI